MSVYKYTIKKHKTEKNIMKVQKRSNKQLVRSAFILSTIHEHINTKVD
jgi:hypothetical protein